MKIIFVVDVKHSALHTSAQQWCHHLDGLVYSASDFKSFKDLLDELVSQSPDLIIFSWRQVLDNAFISNRNLNLLRELGSQSIILALVADHSGEIDLRFQSDVRLSNLNVGIVTVSKRLFEFYRELGLTPLGILPDRPNADLIREVRNFKLNRVFNSVIWVGNSQWGRRQGYKDHKGLESKFKPVLSLAGNSGVHINVDILDSAVRRIPQIEVFERLAKSELLVVTSNSEGTGLPILEALGLGTNVISTDVGIARDFSAVQLVSVNDSPEVILEEIIDWRNHKIQPEVLIQEFESYMSGLENSWVELLREAKSLPSLSTTFTLDTGHMRIIKLLCWNAKFFVRWIKNVNKER